MGDEIRNVSSSHLTKEEIESTMGAVVLDPESLDEAIIGTMKNEEGDAVFVYSSDLLIDCFQKMFFDDEKDEDDEEDYWDAHEQALDWFGYNTVRALPYMGERKPVLLSEITEEDDFPAPEEEFEFIGKRWRSYPF